MLLLISLNLRQGIVLSVMCAEFNRGRRPDADGTTPSSLQRTRMVGYSDTLWFGVITSLSAHHLETDCARFRSLQNPIR